MNSAPIYQPDPETIRRQLPDLGDGLQAQCHDLYRDPHPERCERLALNFEGARRAVLELRQLLLAQGEAGDR
jgi:hypothetical protein